MRRSREFSTRMALGAGQARIVRQILLEGLPLAGVAGALAWWIAQAAVRVWAVETASIYQVFDYRTGPGTLLYLVAISAASALLFSLAPIARVPHFAVNGALKTDAHGLTQGRGGKRLAAVLVAVQMALAIMLLSGAGVLARSLWNVVSAPTGVRDPENILVGSVNLPGDKYTSPAARLAYFHRLEAQLRGIPGTLAESVSSTLPVNSGNLRTFEIEGKPPAPGLADSAQFLLAGADYFHLVGAPALAGRSFNASDQSLAPPVAIVNESFAARFLPGERPLGARLRVLDRNQPGEWRTVVGVVPNIMQGDATRQTFRPVIYLPLLQEPPAFAFFLLRSSLPLEQVARTVRTQVQGLDPDIALDDFGSMKASFAFHRDRMDLEHAEMGKHAAVAPIFAAIALLLAAIGLYAVLAHSVSRRTKEIGVRMAIGAGSGDIRRLIFREGMLPVAFGLPAGLAASLAINRVLQSQLVGVLPYDLVSMTAAPAVLVLVALLACHLPSRRAMRVDPALALRYDG